MIKEEKMNEYDKNILVVDDQDGWRDLLKEVLSNEGFVVFNASSLNDAVSLLYSYSFVVAILDMRLVDASTYNIQGMEVLKKAKQIQPKIKAIILTGYPHEQQKKKALDYYQADGFFEKVPGGNSIDLDNFINELAKLIK